VSRKHKGERLAVGDVLELDAAYGRGEAPLADATLSIEVVAEGQGFVVVNKPAGVAVRPHALDEIGTVLNAMVARHPEIVGVGEGGLRSGIVHRLDLGTSGTLLIATQPATWERFRRAFAEHAIEKRYEAIVRGTISERGQLEQHLRVRRHAPARVEIVDRPTPGDGSRMCSLAWEVIERFGDRATHVAIDLHTGFLHQVRVMMSGLGHSVIGDARYGDDAYASIVPRPMLHAKRLAFKGFSAEVPLPDDFVEAANALRK
ncbi:MAG: RluA family pseudouridine synthase, partial [Phycisphaeraceae bacterium]